MNIGEVVSALALCASSWDDDCDHLLMLRDVYSIEIHDNRIYINFVDGNTNDIIIHKNGRKY